MIMIERFDIAGYARISVDEELDRDNVSIENQKVARRGGNVAGVARKALEAETGKPVVTAQNAESFRQLVTDIVTDAAQLPEQTEENADGK